MEAHIAKFISDCDQMGAEFCQQIRSMPSPQKEAVLEMILHQIRSPNQVDSFVGICACVGMAKALAEEWQDKE